MSGVIESPLAAILAETRRQLGQDYAWPDPSSGLAYLLLKRHQKSLKGVMASTPPSVDAQLLRRSPVLAAYGYLADQLSDGDQSSWMEAVEHLRGRDPYPANRDSFVHNPIEVLGLAHGLTILRDDQAGHRSWLSSVLRRGLNKNELETASTRCAANLAIAQLEGAPAEPNATPDYQTLPMPDLILLSALALAFPSEGVLEIHDIEAALQTKLLREAISISDVASAAALSGFAERLIDRFSLGPQSSTTLEKVEALCRRFPLLSHALQRRYAGRPSFEINDEYDVQDLFGAILHLHFDDVRSEEVTPSYAGNSSRVDFYLPEARMIVEVKMTRKSLGQKEVVNQLIEDAARYAAMDHVDTLVCLVFDPHRYCKNPAAIEADVAESGRRLRVVPIVCPKGL